MHAIYIQRKDLGIMRREKRVELGIEVLHLFCPVSLYDLSFNFC